MMKVASRFEGQGQQRTRRQGRPGEGQLLLGLDGAERSPEVKASYAPTKSSLKAAAALVACRVRRAVDGDRGALGSEEMVAVAGSRSRIGIWPSFGRWLRVRPANRIR
jgi:hypothetical protein